MRIVILLLVVIVSCASPPAAQHPKLPFDVPEKWTTGKNLSDNVDLDWWKNFNDPLLESIVSEAVDKNFNLQAAFTRISAAISQAQIVGANIYPQLNLGFNESKRKQIFIGLPIPGRDSPLSSRSTSLGLALNTTWELDLWGKIQAGHQAALADIQAEQAGFEALKLSLVAQISKTYYAVVEARLQLDLAKSTVENYRSLAERLKERYNKGLVSSLDLAISLANVSSSEAVIGERKKILDVLLRQLETLAGKYPSATIKTGKGLANVSTTIPAGIPADVIARRPDIVSAERQLAASNARIKEAYLNLFPSINITAFGGTTTEKLKDLIDGDFSVWSIVGSIVQPLFTGGKIKAGIDLIESRAEYALAVYVDRVLKAYSEVESSIAADGFLSDRLKALEETEKQTKATLDLAEQRYFKGLTDILTVFETRRRYFEAQSMLLAVKRQRLDARIDLHLALGGSFKK